MLGRIPGARGSAAREAGEQSRCGGGFPVWGVNSRFNEHYSRFWEHIPGARNVFPVLGNYSLC